MNTNDILNRLKEDSLRIRKQLDFLEIEIEERRLLIGNLCAESSLHFAHCDTMNACEHVWSKVLETKEAWRCKVCGMNKH